MANTYFLPSYSRDDATGAETVNDDALLLPKGVYSDESSLTRLSEQAEFEVLAALYDDAGALQYDLEADGAADALKRAIVRQHIYLWRLETLMSGPRDPNAEVTLRSAALLESSVLTIMARFKIASTETATEAFYGRS